MPTLKELLDSPKTPAVRDILDQLHVLLQQEDEETPFPVHSVIISDTPFGPKIEIHVNEEKQFKFIAESPELLENEFAALLGFVLEHGNIGKFKSDMEKDLPDSILEMIIQLNMVIFTINNFDGITTTQLILIIENSMHDSVQTMKLKAAKRQFIPFSELMEFEFDVVKSWNLVGVRHVDGISRMVEKFIKWNSAVGTNAQMVMAFDGAMNDFRRTFTKGVVSEEFEKEIRITTHNPEKHILLRRLHGKTFHLLVLPAKLEKPAPPPPSEYEQFLKDHEQREECGSPKAKAMRTEL